MTMEVQTTKNKGGRPVVHDHEAWRRLYESGCGDAEIARQHGASHTTVIHWRRNNGLPSHNPKGGSLSPSEHEARLRLHGEGLTDTEIGLRLGMSAVGIRQWRRKHGLSRNLRR